MKIFIYDNVDDKVILNEDSILLVREFEILYDKERNKTKKDKTGAQRTLAYKEFKYIFLGLDWTSPYFQYSEQDRHIEALSDSGLTEQEFNNPDFRNACKKYQEIQDSSISMRLLKAARQSVESLIFYLSHVDLNERDRETGKPIFKSKDLISEIKGCKDVIDGLNSLENQVKKEIEPSSGVRGGNEIGFLEME